MVERFNRTLKELVYKYMTAHNTLKYLDTLPELLARYYQRVYSSIDMALADVNRHTKQVVWRWLLKPTVASNPYYSFRPGDFVRTSKLLGKDKRRGALGGKSAKSMWLWGASTQRWTGLTCCTTVSITISWKIGWAGESRVVFTSLNCKR